jgi:hypothetical protein
MKGETREREGRKSQSRKGEEGQGRSTYTLADEVLGEVGGEHVGCERLLHVLREDLWRRGIDTALLPDCFEDSPLFILDDREKEKAKRCLTHLESCNNSLQDPQTPADSSRRIEHRLLRLLQVLVVRRGEAFESCEEAGELTDGTARLATEEFARVRVLLLGHDGRAGSVR